MKKFLKHSMIAALAIFAVSCNVDDVEDRPIVQANGSPVLSAPEEGNVYVMNPETMDLLAERFVWSAASMGEGVIPMYTVEIDRQGDNFDTPAIVGTTNGTLQFAASHSVLNAAILQLGDQVEPFVSANFEVRIKASVGEVVSYSNAVEMIITPFSTEIPKLWVPGAYQSESGYGEDWTHATAPQLSAVEFGSTEFEGYVYIGVDQTGTDGFKFSSQDNWDGTNYGDDGAFAGGLSPTGGNILAPAGYYLIKANTGEVSAQNPNGMTYSLTSMSWGVIGSATPTGWDADTNMTYDPVSKKWTIVMALTGGQEMKFRANDQWTVNFGDNGADGILEQDGANIAVPTTGTYTITLDLSVPRQYTYSVVMN